MSGNTVDQAVINHVALVLDASSSMAGLRRDVVRVADQQIAYLAQRSKDLDQETRVTVYAFAGDGRRGGPEKSVQCLFYDKDVLRLPSIADFYRPSGMTALIDASLKSQDDLAETAQRYGDHAFLTFVLTDGQENDSQGRPVDLSRRLNSLADNWTVAFLVPDQQGVFEAKGLGVPAANIAVWDATTQRGVEEAGGVIREATERFMTNRAQGIRGSRAVFSTGADAVNAKSVQAAGLKPLRSTDYALVPVTKESAIKAWVEEECGLKYQLGKCFYELMKTETIQGNKGLAVVEKSTGRVYVGDGVRDLLGLGGMTVRVKPDHNDTHKIFVQSTSVNRKLKPGTQLLVTQ